MADNMDRGLDEIIAEKVRPPVRLCAITLKLMLMLTLLSSEAVVLETDAVVAEITAVATATMAPETG